MARKKVEVVKPEPNKVGRPAKYTPELGLKVCKAIATSTDSIKKICAQNPEFPLRKTIWEWRFDYEEFRNLYAEARRAQADLLAEEIVEICDDDSEDVVFGENGVRQNSEFIARSRLKVDTRKWIACKLLPKVYGEKVTTESTMTIELKDIEAVRKQYQKDV